jgi:hypothetical protein
MHKWSNENLMLLTQPLGATLSHLMLTPNFYQKNVSIMKSFWTNTAKRFRDKSCKYEIPVYLDIELLLFVEKLYVNITILKENIGIVYAVLTLM